MILTLDRPQARNAYSSEMILELEGVLDAAARDDDVRAVVLTGGPQVFSAGGDLKAMKERSGMFAGEPPELRSRYLDGIHRVPRAWSRFPKPVIAAICGGAIGAGLDLACMCDLRVAGQGATFASSFVRVGLVPGDGGAYFLARTIGFPRALELMLTGDRINAARALEIGLVHRVVADQDVLASAVTWAKELATLPAVAVSLTKRAAYMSWDQGMEASLELAATYQGIAQRDPAHDLALHGASPASARPQSAGAGTTRETGKGGGA